MASSPRPSTMGADQPSRKSKSSDTASAPQTTDRGKVPPTTPRQELEETLDPKHAVRSGPEGIEGDLQDQRRIEGGSAYRDIPAFTHSITGSGQTVYGRTERGAESAEYRAYSGTNPDRQRLAPTGKD